MWYFIQSKYFNSTSQTCDSCHLSCKECRGGLKTDCTLCDVSNLIINHRYDNGGVPEYKCPCNQGFYEIDD